MYDSNLPLWPIIFYGAVAIALVVVMIVLSHILGQRHTAVGRDDPYESGMRPTGSGRVRYSAKYYLVGVFFILFDIEAAIVFAWAINVKALGWLGYAEVVLFIVTLSLGLVYAWKLGALDWYITPSPEKSYEHE